jgi:S-adenosylmethionine-diacylgycerolhomoserine-N-methlytransferase
MVEDRAKAIANARAALADRGEVVIVDFGDLAGLPAPLARAFRSYLRTFHVTPLEGHHLGGAASVRWGPGRYSVVARFSPDRA